MSPKESPSYYILPVPIRPVLQGLTHNVCSQDSHSSSYGQREPSFMTLITSHKTYLLQRALAKTVEYAAGSPECATYLSTNKMSFVTLKCLICKWILYGKSPGDFKQIGNKKGTVTNTRCSNFSTRIKVPKVSYHLLTFQWQASAIFQLLLITQLRFCNKICV